MSKTLLTKNRTSMALTPKEMSLLVANSNLNEEEIQQLHDDFLNAFPSGKLDKKTFVDYYKKLHPNIGTDTSYEKIFDQIDVNDDGTVDFNELLVTTAIRHQKANLDHRLSFVFDIWDDSEDGKIDRKELANLISAMYDRAGIIDQKGDRDPKKRAKEIIAKFDISGDKKLNKHEFITGCKNDPIIRKLLAPHS